jgi:hypothetical protein
MTNLSATRKETERNSLNHVIRPLRFQMYAQVTALTFETSNKKGKEHFMKEMAKK